MLVSYSVIRLRYRAATTKCLLSWNCAGAGVGPRPPLGTGSLVPVLLEPGELGRKEIASVSVLQTIFQANKRCRLGREGQVSHLDGATRCPRDPVTYACRDRGEITKQWGERASDAPLSNGAGGGSDTLW